MKRISPTVLFLVQKLTVSISTRPTLVLFLAFAGILSFPACQEGDGFPSCNDEIHPTVLVHGFLGSGDTYTKQVQRFSSNGYCANGFHTYNYNSIDQTSDLAGLEALIDSLLLEPTVSQVNLVGHSAGGSLSYSFLNDSIRAAKVNRYVHIGSSPQANAAGPNGEVPTLNIYSVADLVVTGADIPGATNFRQQYADHYEVATNEETFEAMYEFFLGRAPVHADIIPNPKVEIAGKALTFGENVPLNGATIEIYELIRATGFRLRDTPTETLTSDARLGTDWC